MAWRERAVLAGVRGGRELTAEGRKGIGGGGGNSLFSLRSHSCIRQNVWTCAPMHVGRPSASELTRAIQIETAVGCHLSGWLK